MKNLKGMARELAVMAIITQLMRGVITGTYAFVIKASHVDAEAFKTLILIASLVGLLNLYIKRIQYKTVLKMFYIITILTVIILPFFSGLVLLIVFEVMFEIKHLLQNHIHNHVMDMVKNTINIRDYHATVDGVGTVSMLIGLTIGIGILHYGILPVHLCVYGTILIIIYEMIAIYRLNK